ncbi:hypothetical protein [Nonomuraea typhae]|uniref:hypothetical protein n=1 Tax=Nonomuraea typhae TaxID=2603600 RepID=UPI0015E1E240|nr:hypothetical protein [Nonomuraea typhae]
MIQGSSWFVRDQTGQGTLSLAIQRICARTAGPDALIHTADLPLGGVQVWAEPETVPEDRLWVLHHRMAREINLGGWHTETGPERLLVLGWSGSHLDHRARVLSAALVNRLADHERTASLALRTAAQLLGRPATDPVEVAADTLTLVAHDLRWPARLALLDDLERTSEIENVRHKLARVAGLEARVRRRCAAHLNVALRTIHTLAGLPAGFQAAHALPRLVGTERLVAATIPNRPLTGSTR